MPPRRPNGITVTKDLFFDYAGSEITVQVAVTYQYGDQGVGRTEVHGRVHYDTQWALEYDYFRIGSVFDEAGSELEITPPIQALAEAAVEQDQNDALLEDAYEALAAYMTPDED